MKALLIANGSIKEETFYKENIKEEDFDFIICADGGILNANRLGITPQVVIGDFDSTASHVLQKIRESDIRVITLPVEKDETDTQAALQYLIDRGYREITMIGCLGNRVDHTLANIYLLKKLLDKGICGTIIDEKNHIFLINKKTIIEGEKGKTLSLIPLSDIVEGIDLKGLYYPLTNAAMTKDTPYGVSNIIVEEKAEVNLQRGELLVIISRD